MCVYVRICVHMCVYVCICAYMCDTCGRLVGGGVTRAANIGFAWILIDFHGFPLIPEGPGYNIVMS